MTGQAGGHIGTRVRAARRAQALSQEDLARLVEVRVKTINRWETGRNEPQAAQLRKLSTALGCSVPWLLDGDPDDAPVAA